MSPPDDPRRHFRDVLSRSTPSPGKWAVKHNSGYSAAKFGGVGLTQSLALDLAEYGITVHSLMLGNLLKSPMFQSLLPQLRRQAWHQAGRSGAVLHRQSSVKTRLRLSGRTGHAAVLRQRKGVVLHRTVHQCNRRSGDVLRGMIARWRCAYRAYEYYVGRIRRSRHPAKSKERIMVSALITVALSPGVRNWRWAAGKSPL
ncbi:sorbitol-6-phosphate dehydrogenase [Citrobacter koseri]|nr:sorbitol-6-phosphate dehydrogenase [Citrobacter koseri]